MAILTNFRDHTLTNNFYEIRLNNSEMYGPQTPGGLLKELLFSKSSVSAGVFEHRSSWLRDTTKEEHTSMP